MAETHDLGNLYVTTVQFLDKASPWIDKGWSDETEEPYRHGKCLVFRVPLTRLGFAVGLWGPPGDEQETLSRAIGLRELGYFGASG